MRRKQHVQPSSGSEIENEFNFGYFYRTVEDHINAFAAQAGNHFALPDIADRVGELLRLKAATLRQQLGASELLLEMREVGTSAGGGAADRAGLAAREALYVRPRTRRTLSVRARKAIAKAQRERWARFHAEQAGEQPVKKGRPKMIKNMSAAERREYNRLHKQKSLAKQVKAARSGRQSGFRMKKAQIARMTSGIKNFWASMTKAQRSAEMSRRRAVADAKKAGKTPPPPPKANASNGAAVAVA
jgi:hypothetical protein